MHCKQLEDKDDKHRTEDKNQILQENRKYQAFVQLCHQGCDLQADPDTEEDLRNINKNKIQRKLNARR